VPARLFRRECDHGQVDVGVDADLVRIRVMARVLVLPPPVAHPDEPAEDEAGPVVPLARAEDLAVCGVVAEERRLREQHGESDGGEHLPPGVADPDEQGDRGGEDDWHGGELRPVVAVAPAHESGVLDPAGQFGELAGGRLGAVGRPDACAANGRDFGGHDNLLSRSPHAGSGHTVYGDASYVFHGTPTSIEVDRSSSDSQ
jgi:hypothetical protein